MTAYIFLYFHAVLFAFLDIFRSEKKINANWIISKKAFALVSFVLFVCIAGFRYRTGHDWNSYEPYFKNVLQTSDNGWFEIGFVWLNIFFRSFTDNYYVMQFCISLFFSICIYRFLFKFSPYPFLSIFIYICTFYLILNMGFTRQFISIGFCILALEYRIRNKNSITLLLLIFSFMLHVSGILFFSILFLNTKKYNRLLILFCISVGYAVCFVLFSNYQLYRNVALNMVDLMPFLPYKVKKVLEIQTTFETTGSGFGFGWLPRRLIVWFVFLFRQPKNQQEILFYKVVFIGLMLELLGFASINAIRASYAFLLVEPILIAYFFSMLKTSKNSFLYYHIGAGILSFYILWAPINWFVLTPNDAEHIKYHPYYSVLAKPYRSVRILSGGPVVIGSSTE